MMSICIPTYEMDGYGAAFLARSLNAIQAQSFTDYEVIVSDHSVNDEIQTLCARYKKVNYLRNPQKRGNSSANLNNAIAHARFTHIKIIFQDDFLAGPKSLACMIKRIGDHPWLVHAYWHTDLSGKPRNNPTKPQTPKPADALLKPWNNPFGAPTAILFKKTRETFDENLIWQMDTEFYYRLLKTSGPPVIVPKPLAVQTLWPGQVTHTISQEIMDREANYIRAKHSV